MAGKRWAGIFPALSTPTDRRGRLDEAGYRGMVRRNIDWGASRPSHLRGPISPRAPLG